MQQSNTANAAKSMGQVMWRERAFWMVFCLVAAVASFETFLHIGRPWFESVFFARITLALIAALSLTWLIGDRPMPRPAKAVYLVLIGVVHALHLILAREANPFLLHLAGVFLVASAVFYKGPIKFWWSFVAPLGIAAMLAPLVVLDVKKVGMVGFFATSGVPLVAVAAAGMIAALRETRVTSRLAGQELRRLLARNSGLVTELRRLQAEIIKRARKPLVALSKDAPAETSSRLAPMTPPASAAVTALATVAEPAPLLAVETMALADLKALLDGILKEAVASSSSKKLKLLVAGSTDWSVPAMVRGSREALDAVLRSLIAHGVESIGGGEGTLRVAWRLGASTVVLTIEDNGRGMNEALLAKLESTGRAANGRLRFIEIGRLVEAAGGRLELNARLGVGSRVMLELLRADTFAHAPRFAPTRQLREGLATPVAQSISLTE